MAKLIANILNIYYRAPEAIKGGPDWISLRVVSLVGLKKDIIRYRCLIF
jgi:hypothetical protein